MILREKVFQLSASLLLQQFFTSLELIESSIAIVLLGSSFITPPLIKLNRSAFFISFNSNITSFEMLFNFLIFLTNNITKWVYIFVLLKLALSSLHLIHTLFASLIYGIYIIGPLEILVASHR